MKRVNCRNCHKAPAVPGLHVCEPCFHARPLRPEAMDVPTDEAAAWARNLAALRPEWSEERIHAALFPDPMTLAEELS